MPHRSCIGLRRWHLALLALLSLFALTALRPGPAQAALFEPDCTVPSLIAAVNAANGNGVPDVISLPDDCLYYFTDYDNFHEDDDFPNALPFIVEDLEIQGNGSTFERDLTAPEFRFLFVENATLTISDLTLTGGLAERGGAIFATNDVDLFLTNTTFHYNRGLFGGAIRMDETSLEVVDSEFSLNYVYDYEEPMDEDEAGQGGAIRMWNSDATVTGTLFSGNGAARQGGAIHVLGSSLGVFSSTFRNNAAEFGDGGAISVSDDYGVAVAHFTDTVFERNTSGDRGGAIYNLGGAVDVTRSTFLENVSYGESGGAIAVWGLLTVTESVFTDNAADYQGGAIAVEVGYVDIRRSLFEGNAAADGGAIHYDFLGFGATLRLLNSTFTGNSAEYGAAFFNEYLLGEEEPVVDIGHLTITGNLTESEDSGAFHLSGVTPVYNSIIAGQAAGNDCYLPNASSPGTIDSDTTCGEAQTFSTAAIDLEPLAENGGPTRTHALGPDSAAIGFGLPAYCLEVDQRGVSRAPLCDSGAFESGAGIEEIVIYVTGVEEGATYLYGTVPPAGCLTFGPYSKQASLSLTGGPYEYTATCSGARTHENELVPPVSVTYSVEHPIPVVTVMGVSDGAIYTYDTLPVAWCQTTGASLRTVASLVITGGPAEFTATCSGATNMANEVAGPVSVTYSVTYPLPTVTLTGVVEGQTYTYPTVPAPKCTTTSTGGGVGSVATLSIQENGGQSYTATCSGATNILGDPVPPVSVTYTLDAPLAIVSITGVTDGATYLYAQAPVPGCSTTNAGGGISEWASLTQDGTAPGTVTVTCSGAKNIYGQETPPISATYDVVCYAADTFSGTVQTKVNASSPGSRQVTARILYDETTCALTGIEIAPGNAALTAAIQVATPGAWKSPIKLGQYEWRFNNNTQSATTGGIVLGGQMRAMDLTTQLTVKLVNGTNGLYFKVVGKAPTGSGSTKAAFEIETTGGGLTAHVN